MRIAVVRGANLNSWELANLQLDAEVVAFGTARGEFYWHGLPVPVRRLLSPSDALQAFGGGRLRIARYGVERVFGDTSYLVGLERALRGFDIAHVAELGWYPYSTQALRARRRGAVKRVVVTVWANLALPQYRTTRIARRSASVAASADRFLAVTSRARQHLLYAGVPEDRIEVIPMGVNLERFAPAERPPRSDRDLRILTVCRLEPEKGVQDLIVALRLLEDRGVNAQVTFAGVGSSRAHLEAMAQTLRVSDRVQFLGAVAHDQVPALHGQADAFVLASGPRTGWQEQFGFALVEAMASGLPVVAGDSGSLDEVVGDPSQLVAPHHPERLAAALARLALDPERRRALGMANRKAAEERYDQSKIARQVQGFYERALEEPPRTAVGG
jgi:glycosyltransferase involved in cell wall biosynthesis